MKKDFELPEVDTEYLTSSGLKWETVRDAGEWVIIRDYPLPPGYNVLRASVALKIEGGYPVSQIDMVYFEPGLSRADDKPIGALSAQTIDGKQFQRWSRHRTGENPWRPGVDDISTQLTLVDYWLEREFKIR